jgi:hypothetical protein
LLHTQALERFEAVAGQRGKRVVGLEQAALGVADRARLR